MAKQASLNSMIVDQATVRRILGVSHAQIIAYRERSKNPLPLVSASEEGATAKKLRYNLRQVFVWAICEPGLAEGIRAEHGVTHLPGSENYLDPRQEQARKTKIAADRAEMELEKMKGELIRTDDFIQILQILATYIHTQLEAVPPQIQKRLPTLPAQAMQVIKSAIAKCCNAAANMDQAFIESAPEAAVGYYLSHQKGNGAGTHGGTTKAERVG